MMNYFGAGNDAFLVLAETERGHHVRVTLDHHLWSKTVFQTPNGHRVVKIERSDA